MISYPIYRDRYVRGLLYSFILSIDRTVVDVRQIGDEIVIEHKRGGDVTRILSRVFDTAYERCIRRGIGIRVSGNDKRSLQKNIYPLLNMTREDPLCEIFSRVANKLRTLSDSHYMESLRNGDRFPPPSILRLEHYAAGRMPYFRSLDMSRRYPSSSSSPRDYTLYEMSSLLAGYVLGKCGEAPRGDERVSLVILPTQIYSALIQFYRLLDAFRQREFPPGLEPDYSLYLWLISTLPEELEAVDVYGIREPGGQKPAEPVFELEIGLRNVVRFIESRRIRLDRIRDDLLFILRESLRRKDDNIKRLASRYAMYIYQTIQINYEACRELLYESSRRYINLLQALERGLEPKRRAEYIRMKELSERAYKITSKLMKDLLEYRFPSSPEL